MLRFISNLFGSNDQQPAPQASSEIEDSVILDETDFSDESQQAQAHKDPSSHAVHAVLSELKQILSKTDAPPTPGKTPDFSSSVTANPFQPKAKPENSSFEINDVSALEEEPPESQPVTPITQSIEVKSEGIPLSPIIMSSEAKSEEDSSSVEVTSASEAVSEKASISIKMTLLPEEKSDIRSLPAPAIAAPPPEVKQQDGILAEADSLVEVESPASRPIDLLSSAKIAQQLKEKTRQKQENAPNKESEHPVTYRGVPPIHPAFLGHPAKSGYLAKRTESRRNTSNSLWSCISSLCASRPKPDTKPDNNRPRSVGRKSQ